MISATKNDSQANQENGRNAHHALLIAQLNNNSSTNSMEGSPEGTGLQKHSFITNKGSNEQEFRMIDSSAYFIQNQQESSQRDEFGTFNKEDNNLLQGGTIGNSTDEQPEDQENDYGPNLYSPLGKKHGRSQVYDQEVVTDN